MTTKPALAIDGGRPVRPATLPYGRHRVEQADVDAVVRALRSDWLTTGPAIDEFEAAFAKTVGTPHAVALSSGTAALHAAAFAAGIGAGDHAVTTPLTFAASANCVLYLGGTVAFADVRPDTLNLDPARVQACLTPRTKAVITVDYTGEPSDLDELEALCSRRGLTLIEDASHSLGATYRGRPVGSVARLTTFSLHPVKHITTGEGGIVTTDDTKLAARVRMFRNHGIAREHHHREDWRYEMTELGFNYRLSDFQAALGLSQLERLGDLIARRRQIAERYTRAFAALPEIEVPVTLPDREAAWHLYVVRLRLEGLRVGRAEVFRALRAENIGVNVHYIPVPWHPYYERLGFRRGGWPVAENAYERMLSLPIFPAMTDADVDDVVSAVDKVLGHYRR
jgi:perosamine synthetase